ncbi:hypothetical protein [Bdellovibrio sp. HCB288]|uniref:hypothetical protein n=1 Tax=Bdellovibrio sp. HCB288 TaxID=3394355 RepID=UPI0039B4413F
MITFFIPDLPLMTNQLLRRHWSFIMKEKQKWHRLIDVAVIHQKILMGLDKPLEKARITFIRRSTREPDYDGLISGFKFVTDGLVESGVIVDDKVSVIGKSEYLWEKAINNKSQGILVCVEGV